MKQTSIFCQCSDNSISPFPEDEPVKEPLSPCHTPPTTSTPTTKRKPEVCGSREKGSTLPTHLPFPDRFSIKVENSIANGNVLSARKQLIADIGQFYYGIASHPMTVAAFRCQKPAMSVLLHFSECRMPEVVTPDTHETHCTGVDVIH